MSDSPSADILRDQLAELSPADAARSLLGEVAICPDNDAGSPDSTAGSSIERDDAVLDLLADGHAAASLRSHLPLAGLEALARRLLGRLEALASAGPTCRDLPALLLDPEVHTVELARARAWALLDELRRPEILRRIAAAGSTDTWAELLHGLVSRSNLTFGRLLEQRCLLYGERTLLHLERSGRVETLSWRQVWGRARLIARSLHALGQKAPPRVAILSENRVEMALIDLACLSGGLVDIMIPATASESDVAYILEHSKPDVLVVSSTEQLRKVLPARQRLPGLKTILTLDQDAARSGAVGFDSILDRAREVTDDELAAIRAAVCIDDLATIMYTSGTTGTPKGICFSHLNIVFKRFARSLALPEIGDSDRLLCYLPLYHTFGRFLELTGCVYWGATYCFAESPAIDTLIRQMRELEPTVFISIPMKWMQLADAIRRRVDIELASDEELQAATREVTGGSLRWGLSAAGYLDPEIFRLLQSQGIELMSGFGMTEATGGITMTPPGRYENDSLGCALPGISIKLADDGELLVRGPYVMIGYLDPVDGETGFDEDGWLHTGDLMEMDDTGFIRIVDRKKEIFKNIKGQTIAPQKIENLLRDFESVKRIIVIGDHRPYNTALIYPSHDLAELDLETLSAEQLKAHLRSLVVSANAFLAPFERIVDFAVIDRDLELDRDELTPKGTYRRRVIERAFASTIRLLYRRTTLEVGGVDVDFPNWLFQALGLTAQDLRVDGHSLRLESLGTSVHIERLGKHQARIGSALYGVDRWPVDLGLLLATPQLWLGNDDLVRFAPLEDRQRHRRRRSVTGIVRIGDTDRGPEVPGTGRPGSATGLASALESTVSGGAGGDRESAQRLLTRQDLGLMDLHLIASMLGSTDLDDALLAVRVLDHVLDQGESELRELALEILRRAAGASRPEVLRRAFQVLMPSEVAERRPVTLDAFLDTQVLVFDTETTAVLAERTLSSACLDAFISAAERLCSEPLAEPARDLHGQANRAGLLRFLSELGGVYPSRYQDLRAVLTRVERTAPDPEAARVAAEARAALELGLRRWLGAPGRIAVDPETGLEYRWEDVVACADDVDDEARHRLLAAISSTPMLREGIFLLSGGAMVRLEDILPGGIWIRLLGTEHGKSVYRVAVTTRHDDQHDLAVNLNRSLTAEQMADEVGMLIVCAGDRARPALVEAFGGLWPEHQLWTEELIPGETLDRALARLARRDPDSDRLVAVWPNAAWSAMSTLVDLWDRIGETDPSPRNIIVPLRDYHRGARVVSISGRRPLASLEQVLLELRSSFISPIETEHPALAGRVGWQVILAAAVEALGARRGTAELAQILTDRSSAQDATETGAQDSPTSEGRSEMCAEIRTFLADITRDGLRPRRLHFAISRWGRWLDLNPEATCQARAATLQEVWDTYALTELLPQHPSLRVRLYRDTVLRQVEPSLAAALDELITRLRSGELLQDQLSAAVADLRAQLALSAEEDYFLTRLSYPYLRPEDHAGFVEAHPGGSQQSEMVVTLDDVDGNRFRIRHAVSAREVARLHRLFLAAKLPVQLRPEHRFLVAVGERDQLLGGLFYEVSPETRVAHMDKVVVAEPVRGKGVAGALIEELCNRLRTEGLRSLTTGFFRPQLFYRHGFTVERRYAGLVRDLSAQPAGRQERSEPLAGLE